MNELNEILKQISNAGERLETFSNHDKNYNNFLSSDLERISLELCKMAENISEIRGFFYGI